MVFFGGFGVVVVVLVKLAPCWGFAHIKIHHRPLHPPASLAIPMAAHLKWAQCACLLLPVWEVQQ